MQIDTRIAERAKKVNPSSTLAITAKARRLKAEGRDIVNLAGGEPDFDTPDFIKEAAIEAIKAGFTKYTPSTGTEELKKLVSDKFKRDNSLDYGPGRVVVSCGAKQAIFNALFVMVGRGDEVLIPLPYWVSYPEMTVLCEGKPRFIKASPKNNFKITAEDLAKNITAKTKILLLNSPSNPCGSVYSLKELKEIAAICVNKKIFVISDEVYEKIIYDGFSHVSIASLGPDIFDLAVTVSGLSKSHSMTGWRIGFLGGPQDIVEAISKVQDHSTSNPSSISQKAAVAALKSGGQEGFPEFMRREFQQRRDYIAARLNKINKIGYVLPGGAFYIFCDISKTRVDSATLAGRLLEEADVSLIPGEGFGRNDFVRISFSTNLPEIEKGMDRIEKWFSKL